MREGKKKKKIKGPGYYVKKRLRSNKPAMVGLYLIVLAHLIAFLGYLIMPDQTPNANDSSVLIKKKPVGFQVKLLKVLKSGEGEPDPQNVYGAGKRVYHHSGRKVLCEKHVCVLFTIRQI
jgi:hypothetical protein